MDNKVSNMKDIVAYRFSWVSDVKTLFNSMEFSDTTGGLENVHCVLPIVGDITVIDFKYINQHAPFIRSMCNIFIYFLMAVYVLREAPKLFGYMH